MPSYKIPKIENFFFFFFFFCRKSLHSRIIWNSLSKNEQGQKGTALLINDFEATSSRSPMGSVIIPPEKKHASQQAVSPSCFLQVVLLAVDKEGTKVTLSSSWLPCHGAS